MVSEDLKSMSWINNTTVTLGLLIAPLVEFYFVINIIYTHICTYGF